MREILFKAKRLDNGEWVKGWYIKSENELFCRILSTEKMNDFFMQYNWHDVIPETVCQYTGLKDKNGFMIFEGDILSVNCSVNITGESFDLCDEEWVDQNVIVSVFWRDDIMMFDLKTIKKDNYCSGWGFLGPDDDSSFEVIGNIHDK